MVLVENMDYKRLTAIDEEIKSIRYSLMALFKGRESHSGFGFTSETNCKITLEIKRNFCGFENTTSRTFTCLARIISQVLENDIQRLEDEKKQLLNKKWFQFWI